MTFDQMLADSFAAGPLATTGGRLDMAAIFNHDIYADEEDEAAHPPMALPVAGKTWMLTRLDWDAFCAMLDKGGKDPERYAPLLSLDGVQLTPAGFRALPRLEAQALIAAAKLLAPLVPDVAPEIAVKGDGINGPIVARIAGALVRFQAQTPGDIASLVGIGTHALLTRNLLKLADGPLPRSLTPSEGAFLLNHVATPIIKKGKPLMKAIGMMEFHAGFSMADLPMHTLHDRFKHYESAMRDTRRFNANIVGAKLKGDKGK